MKWDDAPLLVGGQYDGAGLNGWMDEVRLTDTALKLGEFLRAVDVPLKDIDFNARDETFPLDAGHIDFVEGFGGVGDGKTDNTRAFRKAFRELANKVPLAYNTLYIPPGTYLVSDSLRWSRFFIMQGAGRDETVIQLATKAKGFDDPGSPKPLVTVSNWGGDGRGSGSSIGNYLIDLSLDTGSGNPGATALAFHANNHGAIENVAIRSSDGDGVTGIDMRAPWPGPALIRNVSIDGFDHAMQLAHQEYSMTMENIVMRGQKVAGIHNAGNILALRRIFSTNAGPAILNASANDMAAVLDSVFAGGDMDTAAIMNRGGLYARNLEIDGYGFAINEEWKERNEDETFQSRKIPGPKVAEHVSQDRMVTTFDSPRTALKPPIEDTPTIDRGDPKEDWVNVLKFASKRRGKDWAPAIQAAIDSGSRTVYFPQGAYEVADTVILRGDVTCLLGMKSSIRRMTGVRDDRPAMRFEQPDAERIVAIERLQVEGFVHASPATLVVRHGETAPYRNEAGCGKLFLEDVVAPRWNFDHPQQVWARQWNVEMHGDGPCIVNRGATIWSLGFKTEYESSKLLAADGARTEILGAFIHPIGDIPSDRPIFENRDSSMSLVYGTSVHRANHKVHVRDVRGRKT